MITGPAAGPVRQRRRSEVFKRVRILLAASLFVAAGSAKGDAFDGSQTLICAWIHTVECNTEGVCGDEGDADDLRIPDFIRVDFKGKKIVALDEERRDEVTKIQNQQRENGQLILQGVEAGRAWSLLISETSGDTVLTVSDEKAGFVAFGECARP